MDMVQSSCLDVATHRVEQGEIPRTDNLSFGRRENREIRRLSLDPSGTKSE
jgi:hypothetical protein